MSRSPVSIYRRVSFFAIVSAFLCLHQTANAQTAGKDQPEAAQAPVPVCRTTVKAAVVALDQVIMVNRLGTVRPGGMIYALRRDVISLDGSTELKPGNVQLRADKRPRPIVLRVNQGDCLEIEFQNLLNPNVAEIDPLQPITRNASLHVAGMQAVKTIADNGTYAGNAVPSTDGNLNGLVAPGNKITYTLFAEKAGSYLLYSTAGDFNNFATNQLGQGLFGAVNVQPEGAEWYRSQVAAEDLRLATTGTTADQHPIINYDAEYPAGHPRAGLPILKMLDSNNQIVHTDLTAIITGKNHGRFRENQFPPNPSTPDRSQPYREVTIHYHESQDVVQPFPYFYEPGNQQTPTINAGQDSFAINYGIAGIGPEIIANRIGVGPGRNCAECKFEEFFLSSWVGGDPALIVDIPANAPCTGVPGTPASQIAKLEPLTVATRNGQDLTKMPPPACQPTMGNKATRAYYPDDPSNVYHSYLGDHVKFQILHAGQAVHHVHHHHAHQWLHSPNSDEGHYLDSQAIGPGASFTLDLVYAGSGNRNYTVGDSIFHCHFYPHFASGMWALYRVHDVFERGTPLDPNGRAQTGTRALPDAEILTGTPIPALVPLPTLPMAPLPGADVAIVDGQAKISGAGNPGFPFFVPGVAGHRPPHPPLDFAVNDKGEKLDGGLPRHLILGAVVTNEQHTPFDFTKEISQINAVEIPEDGTPAEKSAMNFFGQRTHASFTPEGKQTLWNGNPANFITNGLPRKSAQNPSGAQRGAPFADPGVDDNGQAIGNFRRYKGVNLQLDSVLNKKGWHFPQQRLIALWGDVQNFVNGVKPPEPLFFRANSGDVVEYWHTNLVPAYYELDDFEVRTPTDILGQHIHLVKFDVMASDGAANGFNYEDGTFSPDEVRSRIAGINAVGGLWSYNRQQQTRLQPKTIAEFGNGPTPDSLAWLGAQATVQRWYVDPVVNLKGFDRTLMTVFTHDHYGPSTHQMAGLYGGLLVEPRGSKWTAPDGTPFGTRDDGGPTSYAANILPANSADSYREFALAWQDQQPAYYAGSKKKPDCYPGQTPRYNNCVPVPAGKTYQGWADAANAINCPNCPATPATQLLKPLLISDFGSGTFSLNYRNEPLPLRIASQTTPAPGADKFALDAAHAFRSITRQDAALNQQPRGNGFPVQPIANGMLPTDPYTPLLRAYENDKVQIRTLVGAHTSMHNLNLHGLKWFAEPFSNNSGYRNSQFQILSEHYEFLFQTPRTSSKGKIADYLYQPSSSYEGQMNGIWGLLRAYQGTEGVEKLATLPNNPTGGASALPAPAIPANITSNCDVGQPCRRDFKISALTVQQALGANQTLIYNSRGIYVSAGKFDGQHPLADPNALLYVRDEDLDPKTGLLKAGVKIEPLILRAAAGDWLRVTLTNRFNATAPVFQNPTGLHAGAAYIAQYGGINVKASTSAGLHAQLVSFDITQSDGANAGVNPVQTVAPDDPTPTGQKYPTKEYLWYAGNLAPNADGSWNATPVELGAANLMPADPLTHVYRGLFGGLIIEPQGSTWKEDPDSRASATVFKKDGAVFREFVLMAQDDVDIQLNNNGGNNLSAFNYKSEPFFYRFGSRLTGLWLPEAPAANPPAAAPPQNWTNLSGTDLQALNGIFWTGTDTSKVVSNELVGGDPQTPVFRAPAGMPVRFRLLDPGGIGDNQQIFELTGHLWQEEPYTNESKEIGNNPASLATGTTTGYGPTSHYDIVIPSAGGKFRVPGDYLYRSWTGNQYPVGLWGLFRVAPWKGQAGFPDTVAITSVNANASNQFTVNGITTVSPQTRKFATCVAISINGSNATCNVPVNAQGRWTYRGRGALPNKLEVKSELGGVATYQTYPTTKDAAPAPTSPVAPSKRPPMKRGQK